MTAAAMDDVKSAADALNDRGAELEFEVSVAEMEDLEDGLLSSKARDNLMGKKMGFSDRENDNARPMGMCSCFSLAFYQPYFDVDTSDVQERLVRALLPFKKSPSFNELVTKAPDAYGPVWLSTTLIFCLASCSNVASYLDFEGDRKEWSYDFSRVASACTIVEIFLVALPVLLWLVGKYVNIPMRLSSLVCLYGYSTTIFIPATFICIAPIDAVDWVVILLSMSWSLYFVLANLWTAITEHLSKEKMLPLLGFIAASHLVWAILMKLLFF
ncbi:hypothetical protein Poli38472_006310 [Pythium oligandrum]|uniref:Protein YIPF n=1 Tax=Pythium oligandrum TaxID=41045 RepID=A0A8K1CS43_PYTOL|nr:hypothetical protein Poli38472_006310 [Pythium oligandrum]|eukprot:TMW68842.1 hypothetical protein Poli38472_006310 [Pythium oligandrum]